MNTKLKINNKYFKLFEINLYKLIQVINKQDEFVLKNRFLNSLVNCSLKTSLTEDENNLDRVWDEDVEEVVKATKRRKKKLSNF